MEMLSPSPVARNISNSEVTTFLTCKRMYEFSYMMELEPKDTPRPISLGNLFHYACSKYFQSRMEGHQHPAAVSAGEEAFLAPEEPTSIDIIMEAQILWTRFIHDNKSIFDTWEILGTEVRVDLPITPTLNNTLRYDLYFRDRNSDKYFILDWKTTYDFWTTYDHDLNPQMPKYIATLQANGQQVDGGIIFEVRTRKMGAEKMSDPANLYRMTRYFPSLAKRRAMLKQQIQTAMAIEEYRRKSESERLEEAVPVLNKYGPCKICNFKDLCNSLNEGKTDLSVDIRIGYTQSTYGYNKENPSVDF